MTTIKNILDKDNYLEQNISVNGWVRNTRDQKDIKFISINDGSCVNCLQLVLQSDELQKIFKNIYIGTSLKATGKIVLSPAEGQKYEMIVDKIEIYGDCNPKDYPFSKNRVPIDKIRQYSHLRTRTNLMGCIFRIKSMISHLTHRFFEEENYLHLDPNVITINECEGGAGVFQVTEKDISDIKNLKYKDGKYNWKEDHFDLPVYLTVSSQLQLEAISIGLGAVYTTNKSFRSEHSMTNKHLSEFTHLEIENCFIDLDYLMDIAERYIKYVGQGLLEKRLDDLEELNKYNQRLVSKGLIDKINKLITTDFKRIKYKDCELLLKDFGFKFGDDLNSEMENYLTEHFDAPVFVMDWDKNVKSFYMKDNDDGTCNCFDLLMPYKVGELIGGSMREDSYEKLVKRMEEKNIDKNPLEFYLDLRRFGSVPHGGFGLGLDRMTMLFTGMENIKDVVVFPVSYKNCKY
jgi:asparaginyl-tRNA synthetase